MILVVGATGALGGAVTRALCAEGADVRVLVRAGSAHAQLAAAGAQPVIGDLKDPASLARACTGIDTLISTANSAGRGGADTTDSVDRQGNRALIDAARAAGVRHFIFVSALGASEQSPADFLRAKWETEQHLRASGMTYTILQPNVFMEVWINMIVGMPLRQGTPVTLVGRGDHRHTFVSMRDVAAFTVAAVRNPAALNETIVITGPDALSWRDVVRVAEQVAGRTIEVRYIALGEPLPGLPPVVSELATAFETYETVIDTRDVARTFGVRLTSVEEFLRGTLAPVST